MRNKEKTWNGLNVISIYFCKFVSNKEIYLKISGLVSFANYPMIVVYGPVNWTKSIEAVYKVLVKSNGPVSFTTSVLKFGKSKNRVSCISGQGNIIGPVCEYGVC